MLLNEHTESRTIKLGLHLSESCIDMEIISTSTEQSKHKQDSFILLGKSGHLYLYDDSLIERYLLQCQSKSTPSLPTEEIVKLPLAESSITTVKFISNNSNVLTSEDAVIVHETIILLYHIVLFAIHLFFKNVLIWPLFFFVI